MSTAYLVFALVTAAANLWAAAGDFRRTSATVANAARVEVPSSWLFPLGVLKAAGGLGLLAGLAVPIVGTAAAVGLVLFFVCAVFAHLRVGWYATLPFPLLFLVLAVGASVTRLASL